MIVKSKTVPANCKTCKKGKDKTKFKPFKSKTLKNVLICETCFKVLEWPDEKFAKKEEKKKTKRIEFSEEDIKNAEKENLNKNKNPKEIQIKLNL